MSRTSKVTIVKNNDMVLPEDLEPGDAFIRTTGTLVLKCKNGDGKHFYLDPYTFGTYSTESIEGHMVWPVDLRIEYSFKGVDQ